MNSTEGGATPIPARTWPALIGDLIAGRHLTGADASAAMEMILTDQATSSQIAGFVVALRAKGETSEELSGLLDAVLAQAAIVPLDDDERARTIDVVGTGGDGAHSINVSTMAALVAAGAGAPVCKHGARSASSKCGTADVLEYLGVAIEQTPEGVAGCVREAGIGFCFAPAFHGAFKASAQPRRELGVPTAFNLIGPMANPGRVRRQLIGVAEVRFAEAMVEALRQHGLISAWVVHGQGLDELTTTGPSTVIALRGGSIEEFRIDPADYGFAPATADDLPRGRPGGERRGGAQGVGRRHRTAPRHRAPQRRCGPRRGGDRRRTRRRHRTRGRFDRWGPRRGIARRNGAGVAVVRRRMTGAAE